MKIIVLLISILTVIGCTDESGTIHALQSQGFTNVQTTGYEPFACGQDDNFSTGFVATNPAGNRVSGVVCCGMFKGCTVRF